MLTLVEAINEVNPTIWGILILLLSMLMGWHGKTELCYYFAGVGSTLAGITGAKALSAKLTTKDATIESPAPDPIVPTTPSPSTAAVTISPATSQPTTTTTKVTSNAPSQTI